MQINHPSGTSEDYLATVGDLRTGAFNQCVLLTGMEGTPDNYKLTYGEGVDGGDRNYPRHHHPFEQVRWALEGDYVIAKDKVLPAGWIAWWPESAWYGPQHKGSNLKLITLQYGGPSGGGFYSIRQRKKGYDDLIEKGGAFVDGMYSWVDEHGARHNQDAAEAVWAEAMGLDKIRYPEPRFDGFVLMNPDTFDWTKQEDAPGVLRKNLGTFTERQVRIGLIHLEQGTSVSFGTEASAEIVVVKHGILEHGGHNYGALTAFGTAAEDSSEELLASEEAELFYVKLPTF